MEYSTLELNVISARDIKDVKYLFSKMGVYVVVSLSGNKQKTKTNVDRDGGTNPSWNFPMKFIIDDSVAPKYLPTLEFKLRCSRTLGGDKDIGEVYVPIIELLNSTGDSKSNIHYVSYQVTRPSGKPKGVLNFSYKFSGKVAAGEPLKSKVMAPEPVATYPAASVAEPSAPPYDDGLYPESAPPPPPQERYLYAHPAPPYQPYDYGYPPPPPPPGYWYPPPPGYGYPQVQQPVPKNNKFGMGLGAGLLGGMLGGILIGDLMSDGADCDAGFGDFGGF
ncbi:protein SRC2-like [Juglans microcarpa x Juglans regia]|uniref:protein SRC2-like n=1 Tax=Juglans microcarpa x Juglans regia TaxID=2249226 RepID=UPI001B7E1C06|nr:protein SRC2-like [Juglans microcarpa x Juglans regia]